MKYPTVRFVTLLTGIAACSGIGTTYAGTANRSSSPVVLTRPAVKDGSVQSMAPFIAARPFDDTKKPDGQAIDAGVPPNTPVTTPEPLPAPAPQVAILQPPPAAATGLLPTGRAIAGVSAPLDAARFGPTLQATSMAGREQVINDLENRMRASESAVATMRRTVDEMSADGRAQFHAANADVNAKEKALRESIKAARKADATNWETSRAQLAADYAAYADALARIDAAAGITPPAK
jgi:hypothetical protein